MNSADQPVYPQHRLAKSFLMHVLPGALVTVAFIILGSRFDSSAYPPLLAFLLVMLFINIPVPVIRLKYSAKLLLRECCQSWKGI